MRLGSDCLRCRETEARGHSRYEVKGSNYDTLHIQSVAQGQRDVSSVKQQRAPDFPISNHMPISLNARLFSLIQYQVRGSFQRIGIMLTYKRPLKTAPIQIIMYMHCHCEPRGLLLLRHIAHQSSCASTYSELNHS